MANCNTQQLNITCGTDVVLHDRLIFDGETFDPNLSVGIAANLVTSLGKRTALDVQVVDDELLVSVPWIDGTLPGCYGLEVTGSCNGKKWATYADSLIKYTKATRPGASEVTVESDSYDITQEVGYCYSNTPVTFAEVTVDDGYGTPSVDVEYEQRVLSMAFHNLKGNGITDIDVDEQVGDEAVNTVTIKTDADQKGTEFKVRNGRRGNGIASSSEVLSDQDGGTNMFTITDDEGTVHEFHSKNGTKGSQGDSAVYNPDDPDTPDFVMANTTGQSTTKTMTQKAITDELENTRVYQFEQIDAANFQVSNYYIRHDTGKWRSYSGTACVLVPVVPGDTYKIIGSGIYAAYLSDNTHVNGDTPTYSGGTTDEFTWPTGVAQIIPEGVNYLYVLTRMNNADIAYELQRLMSIKEKIDNTVNDMVEGFSECLKSENNLHADLAIEDGNGHAVAVFKDGHIITKKFDSRIIGGKYEGKRISILGDSISTFGVPDQNNADGTWTWPGNRCRYPQSNLFSNVKYQYWYLLMERLGMEFGVNESWAGSRVSNTQATDDGDLGPNRCMSSLTRIGHLGANGTPDIIIVYGGTNDAGAGVNIGTFNTENPIGYTEEQIAALPVATFADAYRAMLIRLQYYYPLARIVCLFPTFTTSYYTIAELDRYEEIIREACDFFGVEYLDLRTAGITAFNRATYLPDGIHPNALGMELIYDHLVRNIFN